jgi:hypothetical protein
VQVVLMFSFTFSLFSVVQQASRLQSEAYTSLSLSRGKPCRSDALSRRSECDSYLVPLLKIYPVCIPGKPSYLFRRIVVKAYPARANIRSTTKSSILLAGFTVYYGGYQECNYCTKP